MSGKGKVSVQWTEELAIKELVCLVKNSTIKVAPEQIKNLNFYLYKFLCENFCDEGGEADWFLMRKKVPTQFRSKLEIPLGYFRKNLIDRLNVLLLCTGGLVTPKLLLKKHRTLYFGFKDYFNDENGDIDWYEIREKINPIFRGKFKYGRTKVSALRELNDFLRERNPIKFNSTYVEGLDAGLFIFIRRNFRDTKGNIDWYYIINTLDKNFQSRFSYPIRYQSALPDKTYEDDFEIEVEIGENKEYMYTFFRVNRGEEIQKRNEICLTLVRLAKKGNKTAETRLIDLVSFWADRWVENISAFRTFRYYQDEGRERIRRCIYNYSGDVPFIGYVYKSLEKTAFGLEQVHETSFNDEIRYRRCSG